MTAWQEPDIIICIQSVSPARDLPPGGKDGGMRLFFLPTIAGLAALALVIVGAGTAAAQDVRVEVDHSILLRLDADARIVQVANPSIADVALESPRLIFIVGLAPGQTGLHILDGDGNDLLVGSILVTPSESFEVTLNRNVTEYTYSCAPRCTEVGISGQAPSAAVDLGGTDIGNVNVNLEDLGDF